MRATNPVTLSNRTQWGGRAPSFFRLLQIFRNPPITPTRHRNRGRVPRPSASPRTKKFAKWDEQRAASTTTNARPRAENNAREIIESVLGCRGWFLLKRARRDRPLLIGDPARRRLFTPTPTQARKEAIGKKAETPFTNRLGAPLDQYTRFA